MSLMIYMRFNGQPLGTATGFLINGPSGVCLVTNRHVLTGREQVTNNILHPMLAVPNEILIQHNLVGHLGNWIFHTEPLYDGERPRWLEHPTLGADADIAVLPLTQLHNVQVEAYDLVHVGHGILIEPTTVVSVVGFPFGVQDGGGFAIWATGSVASQSEFDYQNRPVFLIDCRSRQGQSGSPVIAYRHGGWTQMEDGTSGVFGPIYRFLGLYSGRITGDSDLGMVWKPEAIAATARIELPGEGAVAELPIPGVRIREMPEYGQE